MKLWGKKKKEKAESYFQNVQEHSNQMQCSNIIWILVSTIKIWDRKF